MAELPESPLEPIPGSQDSSNEEQEGQQREPRSTSSVNSEVTISGVALDMDGLLFDTEAIYWQVGDTVLQRRGRRYCSDLQSRMMGRVGTAAVQQMIDFHGLDDSAEDLLAESDMLYGELLPKLLQPMPGLQDWIEWLISKNMPFALTTSSRQKWVDVIFEDIEWGASLSFILTGDDVTNGKPHPEMYLTAASKFGIAPETMLVLEDSGNGCAAGVAAGANVVAIPNEHTRSQSFENACLIADSLIDQRLWKMVS